MTGNASFKLFCEVQYHGKEDLNRIFADSVRDSSPMHVCSFILSILHQGIFSVAAFIISVIYLSRFKEASQITLHACTWRPLFLTTLLIADKMWEDKPVRNSSLAKLFPVLNNVELNFLEKEFLTKVEFNVVVKPDLFTSFCEKLLAESVNPDIIRSVLASEYAGSLELEASTNPGFCTGEPPPSQTNGYPTNGPTYVPRHFTANSQGITAAISGFCRPSIGLFATRPLLNMGVNTRNGADSNGEKRPRSVDPGRGVQVPNMFAAPRAHSLNPLAKGQSMPVQLLRNPQTPQRQPKSQEEETCPASSSTPAPPGTTPQAPAPNPQPNGARPFSPVGINMCPQGLMGPMSLRRSLPAKPGQCTQPSPVRQSPRFEPHHRHSAEPQAQNSRPAVPQATSNPQAPRPAGPRSTPAQPQPQPVQRQSAPAIPGQKAPQRASSAPRVVGPMATAGNSAPSQAAGSGSPARMPTSAFSMKPLQTQPLMTAASCRGHSPVQSPNPQSPGHSAQASRRAGSPTIIGLQLNPPSLLSGNLLPATNRGRSPGPQPSAPSPIQTRMQPLLSGVRPVVRNGR